MAISTAARNPLREAREKAGMSIEAVARLLDPPVSEKTIRRWENGFTATPTERLRQLALIYRVPVTALEGGKTA